MRIKILIIASTMVLFLLPHTLPVSAATPITIPGQVKIQKLTPQTIEKPASKSAPEPARATPKFTQPKQHKKTAPRPRQEPSVTPITIPRTVNTGPKAKQEPSVTPITIPRTENIGPKARQEPSVTPITIPRTENTGPKAKQEPSVTPITIPRTENKGVTELQPMVDVQMNVPQTDQRLPDDILQKEMEEFGIVNEQPILNNKAVPADSKDLIKQAAPKPQPTINAAPHARPTPAATPITIPGTEKGYYKKRPEPPPPPSRGTLGKTPPKAQPINVSKPMTGVDPLSVNPKVYDNREPERLNGPDPLHANTGGESQSKPASDSPQDIEKDLRIAPEENVDPLSASQEAHEKMGEYKEMPTSPPIDLADGLDEPGDAIGWQGGKALVPGNDSANQAGRSIQLPSNIKDSQQDIIQNELKQYGLIQDETRGAAGSGGSGMSGGDSPIAGVESVGAGLNNPKEHDELLKSPEQMGNDAYLGDYSGGIIPGKTFGSKGEPGGGHYQEDVSKFRKGVGDGTYKSFEQAGSADKNGIWWIKVNHKNGQGPDYWGYDNDGKNVAWYPGKGNVTDDLIGGSDTGKKPWGPQQQEAYRKAKSAKLWEEQSNEPAINPEGGLPIDRDLKESGGGSLLGSPQGALQGSSLGLSKGPPPDPKAEAGHAPDAQHDIIGESPGAGLIGPSDSVTDRSKGSNQIILPKGYHVIDPPKKSALDAAQ